MKPAPPRIDLPAPPGVVARGRGAFTLIEIMVVVAVMGIVLLMGVPAIYHALHHESLAGAVNDITEICAKARARAIMQGTSSELHIYPAERRFQITGGDGPPAAKSAEAAGIPVEAPAAAEKGRPGDSVEISDQVAISLLDVNFTDYTQGDEAVVRFYANGTCDELTLVLRGDNQEQRKITLEAVTALADVELF